MKPICLSVSTIPDVCDLRLQVLLETLVECGAQVRWCASNIHSTQNEVAAPLRMSTYLLNKFPGAAKYMRGIMEESVTGIHR